MLIESEFEYTFLFLIYFRESSTSNMSMNMNELRSHFKAETLAKGGKWSIIQDFAIVPTANGEVYACSEYNFHGVLNIEGIARVFEVYPISIIEILNHYYGRFNSGYEFQISDVDTIITAAFPEHPDMVSKRSFMELTTYEEAEVKRRILQVLRNSYRSPYAELFEEDEDD